MKKLLALLALCAPVWAQGFAGRVAVIHDGNIHDKDDIGAAAMSLAIAYHSPTLQLVHFQHSNHLTLDDPLQHPEMTETAAGASTVFGFDANIVFDGYNQTWAAKNHLAAEIDRSGIGNLLVIAIGGPWESLAQAFDLADPAKHRFVYIVTHSSWNDDHPHPTTNWANHSSISWHRNRSEFYAQYDPGGLFAGEQAPGLVQISDQNASWHTSENSWAWLDNAGPELTWVRDRTQDSGYAEGDFSDAGMMYFIATGNQIATHQDIQEFFGYQP